MIVAAAVMIALHLGSGIDVDINVSEITSMRGPEPDNPLFTKNVQCLINLTDGKFVTVRETCDEVRRAMRTKEQVK